MRICDISGCGKKHEGRGYCKSHYKSLLKYGDPLQVEANKVTAAQKKKEKVVRTRKNYSTEGTCSIPDCEDPIKSRNLCEKHYARNLRNGSTERTTRSLKRVPDGCLVIDCDKEHFSMGYCQTHRSYELKYGTPYLPKIIKLCGVNYCLEDHWAKGLCRDHYNSWRRDVRKFTT